MPFDSLVSNQNIPIYSSGRVWLPCHQHPTHERVSTSLRTAHHWSPFSPLPIRTVLSHHITSPFTHQVFMEHSAHARHYSRYWEHSKEDRRVKSLLGAYILVEKRENKQETGTECCWWTWQCAPERDQKEERTPEWMRPKLGTSEGRVGTVWLWGT